MNTEELRKQYTQLLRGAPDVLTPSKIVKWTPFGKNVYDLGVKCLRFCVLG